MKRAAVIIAVKKSGTLIELQAALDGARQMKEWAEAHGFDRVIEITDEKNEPVRVRAIVDSVKALVDSASYEQLFVYFAGHGVNLRYSEYWLLSDAPDYTHEAVNVASSVQLAKRCGIPHVVIISDACRTAPEGILAQSITGSEIFPNRAAIGPSMAVDVFYASLLGEPALEIKDKKEAASRYRSIYTEELLNALQGKRAMLLDQPESQGLKYLRSHKLKRHLTSEVPQMVARELGSLSAKGQTPDADILSDDRAFLQEFDPTALPDAIPIVRTGTSRPSPSVEQRTLELVQAALTFNRGTFRDEITKSLKAPFFQSVSRISEILDRETKGFGPMHFETNCGFKVKGKDIKEIHSSQIQAERISNEGVLVDLNDLPMGNVLIEFTDGRSVVLPAIHEFIGALTFEKGSLVQVSYEPSDRSPAWEYYDKVRSEITALRGTIAQSVQMGVFRLDPEKAPELTERIRYMKGVDPTLAIYAAYSYHRMGKVDLIQDMERYLIEGFRASLFDVALLAEHQIGSGDVYPQFPMLAQGWSLLNAYDALTPELASLLPHVASDSLWTIFNPGALPILLNSFKL